MRLSAPRQGGLRAGFCGAPSPAVGCETAGGWRRVPASSRATGGAAKTGSAVAALTLPSLRRPAAGKPGLPLPRSRCAPAELGAAREGAVLGWPWPRGGQARGGEAGQGRRGARAAESFCRCCVPRGSEEGKSRAAR